MICQTASAQTGYCWVDAKTGNPVPTGPVGWSPSGGTVDEVYRNPDPNHVTGGGRTAVRVPCPPPAPPTPASPPANASHASAPRGGGLPCGQAGGVLAQINAARTDPAHYAKTLRGGVQTAAPGEAVTFLEHQSPLAPVVASPMLDAAAARQAADQGPRDAPGHTGTDGSSPRDRVQGAGVYSMIVAEDISLGQVTANGVVRQLIIDAGNPARMHRADLFNPLVKFAGVGCAPSKAWRTITIIDLSGAMMSR